MPKSRTPWLAKLSPVLLKQRQGFPISTRISLLILFFVAYFYVPIPFQCDSKVITRSDSYRYWVCLSPERATPCVNGSILHQGVDGTRQACRTWWHRPVVWLDGPKIEKQRCVAEMGPLADYSVSDGCYCQYQSQLIQGWCRLTDETCNASRPGATAVVSDDGIPVGCEHPASSGVFLQLNPL